MQSHRRQVPYPPLLIFSASGGYDEETRGHARGLGVRRDESEEDEKIFGSFYAS